MPFYQFNPFTGRLKESTHFQPFYPISARKLERTEPPVMIYDSLKTKPVTVPKDMGRANYSTLNPKMARAFKFFQADLEKPVFSYKGGKDKIIFGISVAIYCAATAKAFMFLAEEYKK